MVYNDIRTQWRAGGMGLVGLDYKEVRQACRELDVPYTRGLKRKIQVLEQGVLANQGRSSDEE